MKNILKIIGMSAAVSLAPISAGLAQNEGGKDKGKGEGERAGERGGRGGERGGERGGDRAGRGGRGSFMQGLDADKDGKISEKEFLGSPMAERMGKERVAEIFGRLDKNKDGFIDESERPQRPEGGGRGGDRGGRLMELDADKNGSVSKEEFLAGERAKEAGKEEAGKMFERMDRNKDGVLNREDFQARRPGGGERPGSGERRGSGERPQGGGKGSGGGDKPKRPPVDA